MNNDFFELVHVAHVTNVAYLVCILLNNGKSYMIWLGGSHDWCELCMNTTVKVRRTRSLFGQETSGKTIQDIRETAN